MATALSKALDHIKYTIPRAVLEKAFSDNLYNWRQAPVGLDQLIKDKVIKPRVMLDADLIGGVQTLVNLDGLTGQFSDNFTVIYQIPPDRVSHREIMSVLSVNYLPYASSFNSMGLGMGTVNPTAQNDVLSAGQRVMDSHSNIPAITTATCELIGFNTVLIRDPMRITQAYQLRCYLGNDENLNNINPRSYIHFSKLCELAVKSYIYNKLYLNMDQAYLQGGQELGSFKNYVESLSDAENMYGTFLAEVWAKVAYMNDQTTHNRFLRSMMSPGI